jgi:phage gpG-like protein
MKSEIRTRYNMSQLQIFVKSIDDKHQVQVGIFGKKSGRKKGEVTNAELGAIHEWGSFSRNIPPRSFLKMPISTKSEMIMKEATAGTKNLIGTGKIVLLLKRLGHACENVIEQAFDTSGFDSWDANKPETIRRKGSDSPLIDTGQLRRAIASRVVAI